VGVPQAGYFLDWDRPCEGNHTSLWCNATGNFRHIFDMQNVSGSMMSSCLAANAGVQL